MRHYSHSPAGLSAPFRRYQTTLHDGVLSGREPRPPCDARTVRRWQRAVGVGIAKAISTITQQVLRNLNVSRQEQAFLSGKIRGYNGLQRLKEIALHHGLSPPFSCLLGWAYQICYPAQPWA